MSESLSTPHPRTRWRFAVAFGVIGSLLVAVLITAFIWPAATSSPKNLPIGISGPADRVAALTDVLAQQDPSPMSLVEVSSRQDAIDQIESREIYGAILLDEPEVLVATAASPVAAQAPRGVATQLQSQIDATVQAALVAQLAAIGEALAAGQPPALPPADAPGTQTPKVTVTDVVPLADSDPTGAGIAAATFPLVLGGMLGGILLSLLVAGAVRRLVALAVFGIAAGALSALILQTWFGLLQRDWLLNAAALGLGMTATAAFIIGMNAVFGRPGLGIAAVITVLFANPLAAAAVPVQFLPEPWGQIGQYFVPGAASNLLRSLSYFPDAATGMQWMILLCWTALGVLLALVGHYRDKPDMQVPEEQLEPETQLEAV
ncbi:hypothetical protein [Microbacterium pumilum]|uniref:ABC transporter permease n=1 Tax=Microbacterium pumilum TaxID=344165 RepID=A0ABN2SRX4_9MICO